MRRALLCGILALITVSANAVAGPALDEGKSAPAGGDATAAAAEKPVEYGVGIRLRDVILPKGEIELFGVARAGDSGSQNVGFGVDLIRRRGNVELQLGFEYEKIGAPKGVWIEGGNDVSRGDPADFIPNDQTSLGWFTIEFTFLNHAQITKNLSFRYGGGAGLGIVTGKLEHFNIVCAGGATNSRPEPGCTPPSIPGGMGAFEEGTETRVEYNVPPVFPVVNAIVGLQFKPIDKMTINLEGGIRTFLFFGMSAAYFF
jgi:hypothetical protein